MKIQNRLQYIVRYVTAMTDEVQSACSDAANKIDHLYEALEAVNSEFVLSGQVKEIVDVALADIGNDHNSAVDMTESEKRFKALPWELRAYAERWVCRDWSKAPSDAAFKAQKLAFAVDDFVKSAMKSI